MDNLVVMYEYTRKFYFSRTQPLFMMNAMRKYVRTTYCSWKSQGYYYNLFFNSTRQVESHQNEHKLFYHLLSYKKSIGLILTGICMVAVSHTHTL